ncbi:longitudinals lacking protein, isoforms H/M/V [Diabrotica virgifera virgifera]|uniref:Longitudinals lacking protein, isoforms H/M/V-like n=1 Tax=Diabrotica virgifera virgifera TaxID=50390 RepID=A0A6P7G9K6_DIAVI|nr:longitudinals lacking protein, isoforms H/M/V [Diabrotica virgifera virgifera]
MTSKHFCLKWNKFESNILSAFESLQNTEDLADVTLTCEGINIKAHKFILSACSPYFRTIFKENPCPHPIVILKDVAHADLMAIINFMYHGEVTVSEEQFASFLNTAVVLQVLGLIDNEETHQKKHPFPAKKLKNISDCQESPQKKPKMTLPKPKKVIAASSGLEEPTQILNSRNSSSPSQFEVVEVGNVKTEEGSLNEYDVSENVEVVVEDKNEQGSILEAALEVRDKPSSILEQSLTAQAGKSPSSHMFHSEKSALPDLPPKTIYILRKPPEAEQEKRTYKSSSESSTSPSTFEYPSEFLQQRIRTEDHPENFDVMIKEMNQRNANVEIQPHHSSQCGNCPHCGKIYSNQSALKYHVRLVHSDLTNMYCCHLCPESFDYREGFKKHMAEVHLMRN